MNVAKYIVDFVANRGVNKIFMVTGGQAMFLNDAVYQNKKIKPIFHHHEQAAGMAAEAYGRISGNLGVAMVTAGPAGINVLNGVVGAYVDSAPMMVISGQSSSANVAYMGTSGIRQFGLQGIYMQPIAQAVTKFYVFVDDPAKISYWMEKAYFLATNGRPGPVWIDVPLDMQRAEIPTKFSQQFSPSESEVVPMISPKDITEVADLLASSKQPLLVAGQGIRIAKANGLMDKFLAKTNIPVVTTRLGIDLIDSQSKLFVGRPGLYGDRSANFAVQQADFILSVGARLDPGIIGYDAKDWGRKAKKVVVDIDAKELLKPGVLPFIKIQGDAKEFLSLLLRKIENKKFTYHSGWIKMCANWRKKYPTVASSYKNETPVNSYYLTERLSFAAEKTDMVVVDTSSPFHVVCQAWKIKKGQRFLTTGGISTMGYWPAAIGVCVASGNKRTIIVTGDGCLQMNIQELATVKHNNLPIKLFVINNGGYLLIRHTQKTHMEGRLLGESEKTGLWIPDTLKIARAYGIKAVSIDSPKNIDKKIREVLTIPGPVICDVKSPYWQFIGPRIASDKLPDGRMVSRPYEDMFPFLDNKEMNTNMLIGTSDYNEIK